MPLLTAQSQIESVLDSLRADRRIAPNIVREVRIPAKAARYAPMPPALDPAVVDLLRARGFDRLYTHQAEAAAASIAGENVVLVTPTASGKTLAFNIPVLHRIAQNPNARALYLFPTKALSHDQYAGLYDLAQGFERDVKVYTYDGDTPAAARTSIRNAGQIVVTNPDMLHTGILPHHTKWVRLFENLETVVIDEMHQYRGVFGSHVANVIRRLRRICRFYGSDPKFICCSATIANPREMAQRLTDAPFRLIDESGAPSGERVLLFYNPPVVNRELGIRASAVKAASRLAARFIERDLQTIVFARSRVRVEVLTTYLKRFMRRLGRDPERIKGYRGGYLPNERRAIERGIKRGEVLGVVSTNALELGIDIGSLQVAILTGYPGTIASTRQQGGRAGRQLQTAVVVLIARSAPIDQFLMNHPEYLLEASPEEGILNPDNIAILAGHLKCALHEIPMDDGETFGPHPPRALLDHFESQRLARRTGGRTYWSSDAYPAEEVSLRTATPQNFIVHDTTNGNRVLAEVDFDSAQFLVHPQAIYMHQGETFYVDELDWDRRKAYVRRKASDYYTDAISKSDLAVLHEDIKEDAAPPCDASIAPGEGSGGGEANPARFNPLLSRSFGEVKVTTTVPKFKKIKFETQESVGYGEIHLPQLEFQTEAAWWTFRPETRDWLEQMRLDLGGGLKGLAWAVKNIVALHVMSDPRDLAALPMVQAPFDGRPTVYLYDRTPGGIGLARRAFAMDRQIFRAALALVAECGCSAGCPACVGPSLESNATAKTAAEALLRAMIA